MMKRLMKVTLVMWSAFLVVSCGGLTPYSNRGLDGSTNADVMRLVNQERSKRGIPRVVANGGLAQLAAVHAETLSARVDPRLGKPSHATAHQGFNQRANVATAEGYRVLSEVVMIGYAGNLRAVAQRSIRGWLSSPAHRNAILAKDRRIMGVSTKILSDGRYFVVGLLSNGQTR